MKLSLSSKDILNKEFKKGVKGYDALEVDKFLDIVLQDYKVMDNVVINLNNKIIELQNQLSMLQKDYDDLHSESQRSHKSTFVVNDYSRLDNLELLKKISAYESKLYELGIDPSKIK